MPKLELELEIEQIATLLKNLSQSDMETLEILLNPELAQEIKNRQRQARIELVEGKSLSSKELFTN